MSTRMQQLVGNLEEMVQQRTTELTDARDRLEALVTAERNNPDMSQVIRDTIRSFSDYHAAIYHMETEMMLLREEMGDRETYRQTVSSLDSVRTNAHNLVISQVGLLNRVAQRAGLPPVYDGEVSEKKPYRRELANAVLAWVEAVIRNRA